MFKLKRLKIFFFFWKAVWENSIYSFHRSRYTNIIPNFQSKFTIFPFVIFSRSVPPRQTRSSLRLNILAVYFEKPRITNFVWSFNPSLQKLSRTNEHLIKLIKLFKQIFYITFFVFRNAASKLVSSQELLLKIKNLSV